jgi:DNA adenine methylase
MILNLIQTFPYTEHSKRIANGCLEAKPFLQWVGGKREMIPQYKNLIPKNINKYFEPFLGGGAMFFELKCNPSYLLDINDELIKTYKAVRDYPKEVIHILDELKSKHSKDLYLKIRSLDREYNILHLPLPDIAARMIYLNQTCFNGLYRVNKKGQFNVPIGSSLNRLISDKNCILKASEVLKHIFIEKGDFSDCLKNIEKGDFVYLDPPYFPISINSDFNRYSKEKFYLEDQIRLKMFFDECNQKGVYLMLSNSDSDYIKDLYKDYNIKTVSSSRNLNCKSDKRNKVTELIITNYKESDL